MILILGPCVIEAPEVMDEIAREVRKIALAYPKARVYFKASFDKANRTSVRSFRGPGIEEGLEVLSRIRSEYRLPILTDVHETWQVEAVASVADVLQIPAMLCRQTSLLEAASATGKIVNIKKGQFMDPRKMKEAVSKCRQSPEVWLTERGASFGYQQLVVDYRSLVWMRKEAPVIFDATHSVQLPQAGEYSSGGMAEMIPYLMRAAVAVGVDGLYLETHPSPEHALSDGPNACPLGQLAERIDQCMALHDWLCDQKIFLEE